MAEQANITIPAGTRVSVCRGCQRYIWWVILDSGARAPVSIQCEGGEAPTAVKPGAGINHFIDCPSRDKFSGRARAAKRLQPDEVSRPALRLLDGE